MLDDYNNKKETRMHCPKCGSYDTKLEKKDHRGKRQYRCRSCAEQNGGKGGYFINTVIDGTTPPRILVFDIENAPCIGYFWNTKVWNTSIPPHMMISDWHMISWSAKWLNDSEIMNACITPKEAKAREDKRVVKALHKLFDEADVVIAHNAKKFDVPMANTAFLRHNMTPPSPYQIVDTLKGAKKARFTHNSLNYIARDLGLGAKLDTNFDLWLNCMAGDMDALNEMQAYNDQDVFLLEEVYFRLRPYMSSHPNLNLLQGTKDGCTHCGSLNVRDRGMYRTPASEYQAVQCLEPKCGTYSRHGRKVVIPLAR